jgi:hypothetical protein
VNGRHTTIAEACAADIVCVTEDIRIERAWIRQGTHLNVAAGSVDDELRAVAVVITPAILSEIVAGVIDGRTLDEITIFLAR